MSNLWGRSRHSDRSSARGEGPPGGQSPHRQGVGDESATTHVWVRKRIHPRGKCHQVRIITQPIGTSKMVVRWKRLVDYPSS